MDVTVQVDGLTTGSITISSDDTTDFAVAVTIDGNAVIVDGLKLATAVSKCLVLNAN